MALKTLKCPSCDANIQVNDDREFGFCSYCGAQVQTREVVEIRYTGAIQVNQGTSFQKYVEDAQAYLKMADYFKAEKTLHQTIRDYPGRPEGYEMLIRTITRDYQFFIAETRELVFKHADKMVAVAEGNLKQRYEKLREDIHTAYEYGMMKQQQERNILKLARANKRMKESILFLVIVLIVMIAGFCIQNDTITFAGMILTACTMFMILVSWIQKKILIGKNIELDSRMEPISCVLLDK